MTSPPTASGGIPTSKKMGSSSTPTDPDKGRGKGSQDRSNSGGSGSGDPAENFEDDPDSEAADNAQKTLNEIEAEIEAGEADDNTTGSTGGVPVGTDGVEGDVGDSNPSETEPESGRNTLASNPDVLNNAFEYAIDRSHARDAGIEKGNTTADEMQLLQMADGSQVFATPVSAYPTKLVDSQEEAVNNNIRTPKIINALGGDACKTAVVEDGFGHRFIVREGIEGDRVRSVKMSAVGLETTTSGEDTMAAAYFVGNRDLHGDNMIVNTGSGTVTVIDHDCVGEPPSGGVARMDGFTEYNRVGADEKAVRHKIYDTAHQIKSGEQDLPVSDTTEHYDYAHQAAEKAVRRSYVDSSYDAPSGNRPPEMQNPPDGINTTSDFDRWQDVRVVDKKGEITDAIVTNTTQQEVRIETKHADDSIQVTDDTLNRVVEVD